MDYVVARDLACSFEDAIERIRTLAPAHQLGVVFEVDVQNTIRNKLGEDFRPYRILGLCNPKIAKEAIELDADFGALLPCAVAVQETEGGKARVSFYNLPAIVDSMNALAFEDWNHAVKEKLAAFLEAL